MEENGGIEVRKEEIFICYLKFPFLLKVKTRNCHLFLYIKFLMEVYPLSELWGMNFLDGKIMEHI